MKHVFDLHPESRTKWQLVGIFIVMDHDSEWRTVKIHRGQDGFALKRNIYTFLKGQNNDVGDRETTTKSRQI